MKSSVVHLVKNTGTFFELFTLKLIFLIHLSPLFFSFVCLNPRNIHRVVRHRREGLITNVEITFFPHWLRVKWCNAWQSLITSLCCLFFELIIHSTGVDCLLFHGCDLRRLFYWCFGCYFLGSCFTFHSIFTFPTCLINLF